MTRMTEAADFNTAPTQVETPEQMQARLLLAADYAATRAIVETARSSALAPKTLHESGAGHLLVTSGLSGAAYDKNSKYDQPVTTNLQLAEQAMKSSDPEDQMKIGTQLLDQPDVRNVMAAVTPAMVDRVHATQAQTQPEQFHRAA